MEQIQKLLKAAGGVVVVVYFIAVMIAAPYYNWQYARQHGFLQWLLFGEFVATAKAFVWPYFVFVADSRSVQVPAANSKRPVAATAASESLAEYTDNVYDFGFQFPADWKLQKTPAAGEVGEIRVVVQSPRKSGYVMALVGKIGTSITKEQFEGSSARDVAVNRMIDLTIEQVYRKTSRNIGASRMLVGEKREVPSGMGIQFYISTAHFVNEAPFLVAGIHVVPYDRDYIVTFLMIAPVNPKATAENETLTRIFNSFHIAGERPR